MHCPQCGQQQASAEMRFCSRCGFPLGAVAQILASGGALPEAGGVLTQNEGISPRRLGVRQGVMMMLIGVVVVPILAIFSDFAGGRNFLEMLTAISAVLFFAGGLMRILYATFFEQGAASAKKGLPEYVPTATAPAYLNSPPRASALPPPQATPLANFAPRHANTAELVPPPSVTENTTKLLEEDKVKPGER